MASTSRPRAAAAPKKVAPTATVRFSVAAAKREADDGEQLEDYVTDFSDEGDGSVLVTIKNPRKQGFVDIAALDINNPVQVIRLLCTKEDADIVFDANIDVDTMNALMKDVFEHYGITEPGN